VSYIKKEQKHEFAIFSKQELITKNTEIILGDPTIVHRILNVLRLQIGEQMIVFDNQRALTLELTYITKKNITALVKNSQIIEFVKPAITVVIPILKLENLEQAVYNAVELGATEIQLLTTAKSYPIKEAVLEKRIPAILHAAAELSKNFAIPHLVPPCTLDTFLEVYNKLQHKILIFFDPEGSALQDCLQKLSCSQQQSLFLLVGPEGDLTVAEKEKVQKAGAIFCALTPTVLRAFQAITVGLGVMRAWFNK